MVPYAMKCCVVVGIADSSLSERLQMIEDLTLEKAKTLVRQREAVHEQQLTLQGQIKSEPHLDAVQRYPSSKGKSPTTGKAVGKSAFQHQPQHAVVSRTNSRQRVCDVGEGASLDSRVRHGMQSATSATNEDTMNDFAEPDVLDPELPDKFVYLNTVGSDRSAMWTITVSVNGRPSQFKVDTGAEVTVISSAASTQLRITDPQPTTKQLRGADGTPLCTVGQATWKLAYQGRECMHTLFILPSLEQNLLGLPAIRDLHDLQKVDSLGEPPQAKFPSLFTGLGELKGDPYKIQLKSDATPFSLNTVRICVDYQHSASAVLLSTFNDGRVQSWLDVTRVNMIPAWLPHSDPFKWLVSPSMQTSACSRR